MLDNLSFFKATELRTFLCYHGIVVLKGNVHKEFYDCFKLLHCAVTICISKRHIEKLLPVAKELFKAFIRVFVKLFGSQMVSYNVHNLQHVVDDVKKHGTLDEFSAFEYENCLGILKKYILSGKNPLAEMANRVVEHAELDVENLREELMTQKQYPKHSRKKLQLNSDVTITNNSSNCWFLTKARKIVRFEAVQLINDVPKIVGKSIKSSTDYYEMPIKSSVLDIYYSDGELEKMDPLDFSEVSKKLFCIPDNQNYKVFIPILHS